MSSIELVLSHKTAGITRSSLLTQLADELWREIALMVLYDALDALDKSQARHSWLLFQDSEQPSQPNTPGSALSTSREPALPRWVCWGDANVPANDCTSAEGRLSRQTRYCYLDTEHHPSHFRSPILSLFAICRKLREALLEFRAFWSQSALIFPPKMLETLRKAGDGSTFPIRLDAGHGICSCAFPIILPRVPYASHLRLTLPFNSSYGKHPSEQIFELLEGVSTRRLQYLELRYDVPPATAPIVYNPCHGIELPGLLVSDNMNNPRVGFSEQLVRLTIAFEVWEMCIPVDVFLEILRKCPLLEEVVAQMAIRDADYPMSTRLPMVSLPHLRFFLLCDKPQVWRWIQNWIVFTPRTSIHADLIIGNKTTRGTVEIAAASAARDFLDWDGLPSCSCKVVLLEYCHTNLEQCDHGHATLEFIRITLAATEKEVWVERDPTHNAQRCSLTLRCAGDAIARRYTVLPQLEYSGYDPRLQASEMISEALAGIQCVTKHIPHLDFATTDVLIEKAGGQARQLLKSDHRANIFPNLRSFIVS